MKLAIRLSVLTLGVLAAAPLAAQDAPETSLACLNAGVSYAVGEFACIAACHQERRLARCDVVSDNASWTYVSEACPSAMINQPWPSDWSEIPAVSAMTPIPVTVTYSAPPQATPTALAALLD
jgi:hypothetical protein